MSASLVEQANKLVVSIRELMRQAQSEEDLRIGTEKILEPLMREIGLFPQPTYERFGSGTRSIYHARRPDAVHGQVIVEYEAPRLFSSNRAVVHAHGQLVDYMTAAAQSHKTNPLAMLNQLIGVGFDGQQIFFVQYAARTKEARRVIDPTAFLRLGPYLFDESSARTFLTHLRALARLPLTAEHLARRFGQSQKLALLAVSAFADALEHWSGTRAHVFLNEWKRLFGIVYGERFTAQKAEKAAALARLYGVAKETEFQSLLFCIHTYFALLMKLIAAELITLHEGSLATSFSHRITHASREELLAQLTDIEDGSVYARRGITNFLEGDFFRWYLDALGSPRLEEAIREIARALADFEPATTMIDPDSTRDLLKKLYQYLVPQEVRHDLGEYYTPDWLAELILNEVRYDGNTSKRVIDPACGSGTFLVLAIQRARQFAQDSKEPPLETAKRIVANIWGFDLNPLAVIAARTNFLFALGDLAGKLESFEIPIYLADSVLWPERLGQMKLSPEGESVPIPTSIQTFFVPKIWVQDKGFLMRHAAPLVEEMVKAGYSAADAMARLEKDGLVFPPHESVVEAFYEALAKLEPDKNGIWARFLKNAFAPMVAEKFDYVVGNPPWIRWGYLSQEYRAATLQMWKEYGLFSLKGHAARLGGGEKDFSMLFTYAAADYYLKKGAKLGFLITQEVYKSKGAGEGFRRFQLGQRDHLRVLKAHDLVAVQPFEGAANKTAAIILRKGQQTKYPVPYVVWKRKRGVGRIPTDIMMTDALPLLVKTNLQAKPIGSPTDSWQTVSKGQDGLENLRGENAYKGRLGARVEPYGVFWLDMKERFADGTLLVRNLPEKGKRKIPQVEDRIESDLVFPAVRGADIERWHTKPQIYVLMSQDPQKSEPYPETLMKRQWPRTYSYLTRFEKVLLTRGSKTVRQFAERTAFYAMFGIGPYTVARYKVVWKRMANDLIAAVISQHKTPFGYKTVIPTDTTSLIACTDEAEAHYLCALLNSTPVREFVRSYSSAGRGFGAPSIMSHIAIAKFDPQNRLHQKLSQLSQTLHDLKAKEKVSEIAPIEEEVNLFAGQLFGIES